MKTKLKHHAVKILMLCVLYQVLISTNCISQNSIYVFNNVNVVPMTQDTVLRNKTVVIKNGEIYKIGNHSEIEIPPGVIIINGMDKFLMPGLADMHVHLNEYDHVPPTNIFLANGVTTIRNMGGDDGLYTLRWRNLIYDGKLAGPRIIACGPVLYHYLQDVDWMVQDQKERGYDFLKLYSYLSKESYKSAIEKSKNEGLYTVGHIPYAVGFDYFAKYPMNEVAHIEEVLWQLIDYNQKKSFLLPLPDKWGKYFFKQLKKDFRSKNGFNTNIFIEKKKETIDSEIAALKLKDITVCTTLAFGDLIQQKLMDSTTFLSRPESKYFTEEFLNNYRNLKDSDQKKFKKLKLNKIMPTYLSLSEYLFKEMYLNGINLVLGTDALMYRGWVYGYSVHDELEKFVDCGLSPYEAICLGTKNASLVTSKMGIASNFGTIEVGNIADLVLTEKNPLDDINNIKEIRGVMARGIWYSKETLDSMSSPDSWHKPMPPIDILSEIINEKGLNEGIDMYNRSKNNPFTIDRLILNLKNIDNLGHKMLDENKINESIAFFKLNVDEYPNSERVHNSLGEAYLRNNELEKAEEHFRISLKLKPILNKAKRNLRKVVRLQKK